MPKLTFQRQNKTLMLKAGTELARLPFLDASQPLNFSCCQGVCGTCAMTVIEGEANLSPPTAQEKETLERLGCPANTRLACQCALLGNVTVDH